MKTKLTALILVFIASITTARSPEPAAAAAKEPMETAPAVEANNAFAFDLFKQLSKEHPQENLFFSPYSISSALAMTTEGARGETALQMGEVLGYPESLASGDPDVPWDMEPIHSGMSALVERFNRGKDQKAVAKIEAEIAEAERQLDEIEAQMEAERDRASKEFRVLSDRKKKIAAELFSLRAKIDQYELSVTNELWAQESYPFGEDYFTKIQKFYKTGGVFLADFVNSADEVRIKINSRVEELTQGRIKDLIPEKGIDELTRLVLVNAIYFKGEWSVSFLEKNTVESNFTLADGENVKRPIMRANSLQVAHYAAFEADGSFFDTPEMILGEQKTETDAGGFAVLELPYKGDELSMVVIAPNTPGNLGAIEGKLDVATVEDWIGTLKKRDVHVHLPKFKVETKYTLGDKRKPQTLQKMGMIRAFLSPNNPEGADFDGMSPTGGLYISKVLHKAFFEVNEKGSEAAAATAVVMATDPFAEPEPFTPTFKADRPFIYLIRDRVTGTILFVGRIMDPVSG